MGIGWNEPEHARLGLPFPGVATRTQLLEEQVEIISRQWSEDRFDFDGQHYRLAGCEAWPKPLQRPRLPIIIGGSARPRTVALRRGSRTSTTRRSGPRPRRAGSAAGG